MHTHHHCSTTDSAVPGLSKAPPLSVLDPGAVEPETIRVLVADGKRYCLSCGFDLRFHEAKSWAVEEVLEHAATCCRCTIHLTSENCAIAPAPRPEVS